MRPFAHCRHLPVEFTGPEAAKACCLLDASRTMPAHLFTYQSVCALRCIYVSNECGFMPNICKNITVREEESGTAFVAFCV